MIDQLIQRIDECNNPSVAGIDTAFEYLPRELSEGCETLEDAGRAIAEFNCSIIDAIADIVPAVKVQVAYYEMYGVYGLSAFEATVRYAKQKGLIVIADVKRNDIGSTAGCYSKAYLSGVTINGNRYTAFPSDFITVNGYLGYDGIKPFAEDCKANDRGLFILVKTSNPSSGELQDREFAGGKTLYAAMGDLVAEWGADSIGKYGYSDLGAVVGATHPRQADLLRTSLPGVFFLVPGYGAQGGTAEDLSVCFDRFGRGAIVNSSRGILCAYRNEKYKGQSFEKAARSACIDMQKDISSALHAAGKIK